jgi:hypothetical protein
MNIKAKLKKLHYEIYQMPNKKYMYQLTTSNGTSFAISGDVNDSKGFLTYSEAETDAKLTGATHKQKLINESN